VMDQIDRLVHLTVLSVDLGTPSPWFRHRLSLHPQLAADVPCPFAHAPALTTTAGAARSRG
jgi:hypothetical protein